MQERDQLLKDSNVEKEAQIGRLLNIFDKVDPLTSYALTNPTVEQVYKLILAKIDHVLAGDLDAVHLLKEKHRIDLQRQEAMLDDLERNLAESKARIARLESENARLSHQVSINEAISNSPPMPSRTEEAFK